MKRETCHLNRKIRFASLALLAPLALFAKPAAAQDQGLTVAVLPFENSGSYGQEKEVFDALRKGLAAMLSSELAGHSGLRPVNRTGLQRVLEQQGLAAAERIDRESALRIGKQVSARYLVTGSFIDLYGDVRFDARLLEGGTGQVLKAVRSDPALRDRDDLYRMVRSLALQLTEGTPLSPSRRPAEPPSRDVPTEGLLAFSRGLLFEDRGDRAGAAEHYRRALALAPGYSEAEEGLRRVGGSK